VKQITGGDTIKVKELYRAPFAMKPKFKLIVVCNKKPELDVYDAALRRRINLIPFDNVVPREKRDRRLLDKLKGEASGILNWLVKGAKAYYQGTIKTPEAVKASTEEYFFEKDSVNGFLNAHTVLEPGSTVPKGALYDGYKEYCDAEMLEPVNKREFGAILRKKGLKDGSNGQNRLWKGLRYSATEAVPAFFSPSPASRIQMGRQKDVEGAKCLLDRKA
jgi:putative DNA primase/helicase